MTTKYKKHQYIIEDVIKENNFKIIAEIGIYNGTMTDHILTTCESVNEYWAIDQWIALSEKHDKLANMTEQDWYAKYCMVCKLLLTHKALRILKMTSVDAAKLFPDNYFDFVFIDASHFYEDTKTDILAWHPKVKIGKMLAGHDYGRGGQRGFGVEKAVDEIFGSGSVEILGKSTWVKRI